MNKNILSIELDIYERKYVTEHNLEYISYTNEYVNGFIGEIPRYGSYNYHDKCIIFVKKLLLINDRIKKKIILKIEIRFSRKDMIQHLINLLKYISYLEPFITYNDVFKNVYLERLKFIYLEIKKESIDDIRRSSIDDINCIINSIKLL